mgnify:FL=1
MMHSGSSSTTGAMLLTTPRRRVFLGTLMAATVCCVVRIAIATTLTFRDFSTELFSNLPDEARGRRDALIHHRQKTTVSPSSRGNVRLWGAISFTDAAPPSGWPGVPFAAAGDNSPPFLPSAVSIDDVDRAAAGDQVIYMRLGAMQAIGYSPAFGGLLTFVARRPPSAWSANISSLFTELELVIASATVQQQTDTNTRSSRTMTTETWTFTMTGPNVTQSSTSTTITGTATTTTEDPVMVALQKKVAKELPFSKFDTKPRVYVKSLRSGRFAPALDLGLKDVTTVWTDDEWLVNPKPTAVEDYVAQGPCSPDTETNRSDVSAFPWQAFASEQPSAPAAMGYATLGSSWRPNVTAYPLSYVRSIAVVPGSDGLSFVFADGDPARRVMFLRLDPRAMPSFTPSAEQASNATTNNTGPGTTTTTTVSDAPRSVANASQQETLGNIFVGAEASKAWTGPSMTMALIRAAGSACSYTPPQVFTYSSTTSAAAATQLLAAPERAGQRPFPFAPSAVAFRKSTGTMYVGVVHGVVAVSLTTGALLPFFGHVVHERLIPTTTATATTTKTNTQTNTSTTTTSTWLEPTEPTNATSTSTYVAPIIIPPRPYDTGDVSRLQAQSHGVQGLAILERDDRGEHADDALFVAESITGTIRKVSFSTGIASFAAGRNFARLPHPLDCTTMSPCDALTTLSLLHPGAIALRYEVADGRPASTIVNRTDPASMSAAAIRLYVLDVAVSVIYRVDLTTSTAIRLLGELPPNINDVPPTRAPSTTHVDDGQFFHQHHMRGLDIVTSDFTGTGRHVKFVSLIATDNALFAMSTSFIVRVPLPPGINPATSWNGSSSRDDAAEGPSLPGLCVPSRDCVPLRAAFATGLRYTGCLCQCSKNYAGLRCGQRLHTASATVFPEVETLAPIPTLPKDVATATTASVGATSVVIAVVVGNPIVAVQASRGALLLSMAYCEPAFDSSVPWPDHFLQTPIKVGLTPRMSDAAIASSSDDVAEGQAALNMYVGAAVYNPLVLLAMVGAHVLVIAVVAAREKPPQRRQNNSDGSSAAATVVPTLAAASSSPQPQLSPLSRTMALLKFPSTEALFVFLVLQGSAKAGALLIRESTSWFDVLLGSRFASTNRLLPLTQANGLRNRSLVAVAGLFSLLWPLTLIVAMGYFILRRLQARYVDRRPLKDRNSGASCCCSWWPAMLGGPGALGQASSTSRRAALGDRTDGSDDVEMKKKKDLATSPSPPPYVTTSTTAATGGVVVGGNNNSLAASFLGRDLSSFNSNGGNSSDLNTGSITGGGPLFPRAATPLSNILGADPFRNFSFDAGRQRAGTDMAAPADVLQRVGTRSSSTAAVTRWQRMRRFARKLTRCEGHWDDSIVPPTSGGHATNSKSTDKLLVVGSPPPLSALAAGAASTSNQISSSSSATAGVPRDRAVTPSLLQAATAAAGRSPDTPPSDSSEGKNLERSYHVSRFGAWFANYRGGTQAFGVLLELPFAYVTGILDALRTADNCSVVIGVTTIAYVIFAIVTCVLRPQLTRLDRSLAVIIATAQALSAMILLYGHWFNDQRLFSWSAGAALFGMWLVAAGSLFEIVSTVKSIFDRISFSQRGKRGGAAMSWREKVKACFSVWWHSAAGMQASRAVVRISDRELMPVAAASPDDASFTRHRDSSTPIDLDALLADDQALEDDLLNDNERRRELLEDGGAVTTDDLVNYVIAITAADQSAAAINGKRQAQPPTAARSGVGADDDSTPSSTTRQRRAAGGLPNSASTSSLSSKDHASRLSASNTTSSSSPSTASQTRQLSSDTLDATPAATPPPHGKPGRPPHHQRVASHNTGAANLSRLDRAEGEGGNGDAFVAQRQHSTGLMTPLTNTSFAIPTAARGGTTMRRAHHEVLREELEAALNAGHFAPATMSSNTTGASATGTVSHTQPAAAAAADQPTTSDASAGGQLPSAALRNRSFARRRTDSF